MNKPIKLFFLFLMTALLACGGNKTKFTFATNEEGVEVLENGKPVFFYRRKPNISQGKYICSNYIHPLYSLGGDTLTEEFPADHPYHRGIYWAWHQHYIGENSIGDGWFMEEVTYDVAEVKTDAGPGLAQLDLHVLWRSKKYENGKPYMDEHTTIIVRPSTGDYRIIDFRIALRALVPGVSLGGSDNEKGYGGFCCHIRTPGDLTFISSTGRVTPQTLQVKAGPWMDFSGTFGKEGKPSGFTLMCHKSDPGYPQPWILRQKGSMQNIVWPGRERVAVPTDKPVVLHYRLVVHEGNSDRTDLRALQKEYNALRY